MAKLAMREASRLFRVMGRDIVRAVERSEKASAVTGVQLAKGLSGGGKSSAQLAREDHPFAKRHGSPKDPTDVINQQSGIFARTWRLKSNSTLSHHAPVIVNDTSYADFLRLGTRFAFARDIDETVLDLLQPIRESNLRKELKKLER